MKSLPVERLKGLLDNWGIPDDRVPTYAQLLASMGVTMKGLAQANMAILAAVLAGDGEQAALIHNMDANAIIKGAAAEDAEPSVRKPRPAQYLQSALPEVDMLSSDTTSKTSEKPRHPCVPSHVEPWVCVTPGNPDSGSVFDAIRDHQEHADDIYPALAMTGMHPPYEKGITDSEQGVSSNLQESICAGLNALEPGATWALQPPDKVLQDALAFAKSHNLSLEGWLNQLAEGRKRALSAPLDGSLKRVKMDVVLTLRPPRTASAAAHSSASGATSTSSGVSAAGPPAEEDSNKVLEVRCMGELKEPKKLGCPQPIDLCEAYNNPGRYERNAKSVIHQGYTYMLAWRLFYSFISNWYGFWLLHCPPSDRGTLYVSQTIAWNNVHPAPTARGAVAWLESMALQHTGDEVADVPQSIIDAADTADDGGGGSHEGGGPGDPQGVGDSTGPADANDTQPAQDSGHNSRSTLRAGKSVPVKTSHHQATRFMQASAESTRLPIVLADVICEGSCGLVVHGTCGGEAAVIKLLGPSAEGLAAYRCEVDAYRRLKDEYGRAVPRPLAAGHLGYGVYAIATARVEGTPLSEERIDDAVQHSAVAALSRVHAANGGLCHGDVRLENLMLVERDAGPTHCVVLDFGQARLDGDQSAQEAEIRRLLRLLKDRKR